MGITTKIAKVVEQKDCYPIENINGHQCNNQSVENDINEKISKNYTFNEESKTTLTDLGDTYQYMGTNEEDKKLVFLHICGGAKKQYHIKVFDQKEETPQ